MVIAAFPMGREAHAPVGRLSIYGMIPILKAPRFACTLFLASLLPAAFCVGCAAQGTHSSTGEYLDDSVITTKVKTALLNDSVTPGSSITVNTVKGTVQLSGFVDTAEQKSRAHDVAAAIAGVRSVQNNIIVKSSNAGL
jgi:hyperosmotically inducible periplasmic protein